MEFSMKTKFWITLFISLLSLCLINGIAFAQPREYQVKAVFLYNFARFVTWPSLDEDGPFTFCILGSDPFGDAIDAMKGKTIRGRPIRIISCQELSEAANCQVLFISRSEKRKLSMILEEVAGSPVLTVSDINGFVKAGGMIQLFIEEKKIRFKINQGEAESAGLKISSQLLKLGR